ncbi:MAG TPA: hypothetical protein VIM14_07865 [Polyangia bacterium]
MMRTRPASYGIVCASFLLGSCATKSPHVAEPKIEAAPPASRVEKVREPLEVTPLELHFSGLRGEGQASESVAVKNTGSDAVQVSDLRVVGAEANTFKIVNVLLLPAVLAPGASFSFSVGFEPSATAEPGVHHARVRIVRNQDDDGPPCDLTGLVTKSKNPADEPPLHQILEALGYEVDVGGTSLVLPADARGDEVKAPLFQRAKPGSVGLYLIARYTASEATSFGYYTVETGKPSYKSVGSAAQGQNHTLNPELEGDSETSFEPGKSRFGLYVKARKRRFYSDDGLNSGPPKHVAKVFPLLSRGRTPVQDAYVVAFDEDGDRDYQDHVFMLWNVQPTR